LKWAALARRSGALVGFVTVEMPSGMTLHECPVFERDGAPWCAPPSRARIAAGGTVVKDAAGKVQYDRIVSFIDRERSDTWSVAVIKALQAAGHV
jgi:hypothetical protein